MAASSSQKCSKRSKVWEYFSKGEVANEVTCLKCTSKIKVKESSTTNMHIHLKRQHSIEVDKVSSTTSAVKKKKTTTDTSSNASTIGGKTLTSIWTKLSKTSDRHQKITKSIAKYIILDMRPLSSVDNTGFLQLLHTLEPRYDVDSRSHITQIVIPEMYASCKEKLQLKLSSATFIPMTTDAWTSCSNKSFITITVHLLSDDWSVEDFVLTTYESVEAHTIQNLTTDFLHCLEQWNISPENVSCTTDNAANIVGAMKNANIKHHVRCAAHTLNLAVQKGLQVLVLDGLLGRIRVVVKYFNKSTLATNIF